MSTDPNSAPNERLQALHHYDSLDTPPEDAFDRLTRLAAQIFDVRIAYVTLMVDNRPWLTSTVGLSENETTLAVAFCEHTIEANKPLVIEDATVDARFRDDPRMTEEELSFYAGAPLVTSDGRAIGTLGIMDTAPRRLSGSEVKQLTTLADAVMDELGWRERTRDLEQRAEEARSTCDLLEKTLASIDHAIFVIDAERRIAFCNAAAEHIFGYNAEELIGASTEKLHVDLEGFEHFSDITDDMLKRRGRFSGEHRMLRRDGTEIFTEHVVTPVADPDPSMDVVSVVRDVTEQKKREQALEEVNDRIERTLHGTASIIYEVKLDTGAVARHGPSRYVLGVGQDEYLSVDTFAERVVHPDDQEQFHQFYEDLKSGARDAGVLEYRSSSGTEKPRWIQDRARVFKDNGRCRVFVLAQDITERKEAEQRLQKRTEAIEASAEGIAITDEDGRFTYVNPAHINLYGCATAEELQGQSWRTCYSDEEALRLEQKAFPTVAEVGAWRGEAIGLRKDGSTFPQEISLTQLGKSAEGVICIARDLTEQKRQEQERREQDMFIRSITESVTDGILQTTREGEVRYANQALADMFGYESPQALHGVGSNVLYEDPTALERLLQKLHGAGSFTGEDVHYRRKDGTAFVGRTSAARVYKESSGATYHNSVIVDVTDQKAREQALREAKEEAEAAARFKETMLANMSHEIRSPLTSMIGFAEILNDSLNGDEQTFAAHILNGGERLARTLEAILELSKIEGDAYQLKREPTDLDALMQLVASELRPRAEKARITLSLDSPPDPLPIAGVNTDAMRRVLANLVENAIKYTPVHGEVTLRTRHEDGGVVLEVEDNGIGISEHAQASIFEPFKQESEGLQREYEGVGLGLSIVKELVAHLDGSIELQSTKGIGSRFTVHLPRYQHPAASEEDPAL